jgi:hypothetical protein
MKPTHLLRVYGAATGRAFRSSAMLSVAGFALTSAIAQTLYVPGGTTTGITSISGTNVGIGESTPDTTLHVTGSAASPATSGTTANGNLGLETTNGNSLYMGSYSASPYASWIQTGNRGSLGTTYPLVLNPNGGNVGIGTTIPQYKLDILNGQVRGLYLWAGGTNSGYDGRIYVTNSTGVTDIYFDGSSGANSFINNGGNVGIGTTNPGSYKLAVNGTIHAKGVAVNQTGWSDYVFEDSYQLSALSDVEHFIKVKKHLPGIPSEAEVAKEGVDLGDMQARLLAKVEELTLHQIAQEKQLAAQAARIVRLEQENARLNRQQP